MAARTALVAVEDGALVGFVAGHGTRRYGCEGELQWINVAEAQRGQGVACTLLVKIAVWFAQQNALRVCVNVDPKNVAARGLYTKFGAQPLNEHWMVWEDIRVAAAR
ncbi:MAG TPA: GNAT family N-acetyltransferase [Candidatus Angelobacter sp.]|nr:GNAT family N-acetyltransferase [Candidatus Angelobacter sp.]